MELISDEKLEQLTENSDINDTIKELQALLDNLKQRLVGKTLCPTEFFATTQDKTEEPTEYYGPIHISKVPSVGTIEQVGNLHYKWTERKLSPAESSEELMASLKSEEAIKFSDIFIYHNGSEYVKLFKKNITPRYKPEGGERFPTPKENEVLTGMMSEKTTIASAQQFINKIERK